jgi:hypothetical protein
MGCGTAAPHDGQLLASLLICFLHSLHAINAIGIPFKFGFHTDSKRLLPGCFYKWQNKKLAR